MAPSPKLGALGLEMENGGLVDTGRAGIGGGEDGGGGAKEET